MQYAHIYIYIIYREKVNSAGATINRIQNKSFCVHKICVYTVIFIMYIQGWAVFQIHVLKIRI